MTKTNSLAEELANAGFTHTRNDEDGVSFWEKETTTVAIDPVEDVALITRYSPYNGQRNMFTRITEANAQAHHIALIATR